jgi:hypothetical protein
VRVILAAMLIGAAIPVIVCAGCSVAQPTKQSPRCYAVTGHTVSGDFLHAFDAWGGSRSLGYPITEPLVQEGRIVQYFTYARLEDHPDNPGGRVVKLSMLGERLGRWCPPLDARRVPPVSEPDARYYAASGHAVRGDLLYYLDANGGIERFGFPIGEPLASDGVLVQDFQRMRLVWHAGADQRVTMEASGRAYFDTQALDQSLLAPRACPADAEVVATGD